MACYLAGELGVNAWIVLYREGLGEFWIYCLTDECNNRWYHYDQVRFEDWLKGLERIIDVQFEKRSA